MLEMPECDRRTLLRDIDRQRLMGLNMCFCARGFHANTTTHPVRQRRGPLHASPRVVYSDTMAFGLVFLDHAGDVWTVDAQTSEPPDRRSLIFSRPTFLEPMEQRAFVGIPGCWPNCTEDELRTFLDLAIVRTQQ
jgi:hypothetical protein